MSFDSLVLSPSFLLLFAFVSICLAKSSSLEPSTCRLVDGPPLSLLICEEVILHLSSAYFLLSFSNSSPGCLVFVFFSSPVGFAHEDHFGSALLHVGYISNSFIDSRFSSYCRIICHFFDHHCDRSAVLWVRYFLFNFIPWITATWPTFHLTSCSSRLGFDALNHGPLVIAQVGAVISSLGYLLIMSSAIFATKTLHVTANH